MEMSIKEMMIRIEKQELKLLLDDMASDNLIATLERLEKHIFLLKQINDIEYQSEVAEILPSELDQEIVIDDSGVQKKSVLNTKKTLYKEESGSDHSWFRGPLTRHLKGGSVGSFQDVYVPERVIRELALQPFDWIQANLLDVPGKKSRYEFMLLERHSEPFPRDYNRVEVTCTPTFKHQDLNRFYIKVKTQESDNSEESATQVLLSEKDVTQFRIDERSIIDYAYHQNSLTFGRVTWKHSDYGEVAEVEAPSPPKKVRKQTSITKPKESVRTVRPIFKDVTVAMVGGGNRNLQTSIKKEVERRDGTFIFCSGDEPRTTIKSRLKRSNAVVIFTESISHDAMNVTKDVCKEFDIPVSYTKNLGSDRFIVRVNSLLKKES